MTPVAVLFARSDSIYKRLPQCDVYDVERDAMTFRGGVPVVAHPPCRCWGRFAWRAKPRDGERELALWAVDQIRTFGGVLEHPATSRLWAEKPLPDPGCRDDFGGWTLVVSQWWWGHRAEKATRLYICGCEPRNMPQMPYLLGEPRYCVAPSRRNGANKKIITKAEREATPPAFAAWLCDIARRCCCKIESLAI